MSVKLSPLFNEQQFDANGNPLSGGKLYTYAAGSSTPQTSYTDSTGATPQANPIILNSRGEPTNAIWLTTGLNYKFALHDSDDVLIRTIDNVSGVNDTASPSTSEWIDLSATPTYTSAATFTVLGDKTSDFQVNRRVKCSVTAGTVYGYISVSAFTTLTTVTVVLDSGSLDAGLSAVQLGLLTVLNESYPKSIAKSGANSDITSLSAVTALTNAAGVDIKGTNTNDASAQYYVGESIESSVTLSPGVSAGGSTVYTLITSIDLTAGDWDISGSVVMLNNGATISGVEAGYISTDSGNNSTGSVYGKSGIEFYNTTATANTGVTFPQHRLSLSGAQTLYLKGYATYSAGTPKFGGFISARRVR